ncbi:MAG: carboxypeptidase regulatory-like domain-containing protein [Marinilabiliaceae bacterium]|nr:carboxypeptidase regulatory-like domain-containing protein [Marinilabiliaceae bacterium]
MKQIILVIIIAIFSTALFSQNKKLQKADELFDQFNYSKALNKYLKLENNNVSQYHVKQRIAFCYVFTNDLFNAEQKFKDVLNFPDVDPSINFHLGQVLLKLGKLNEAVDYLNTYFSQQKNNTFKLICNDYSYYLYFLNTPNPNIKIQNLAINTHYSEFAPTLFNSDLFFSSNRPTPSLIKRGDVKTENYFFDIYQAKAIDLSTFKKPTLATSAFNSRYNDGPICFSKNNTIAFITQNDIKKRSSSQLDIVISKNTDGEWSQQIDHLSTRDKNFSIAHPFITNDMNRLYFISNMAGGYGGMDIYYSEFKNGFISTPINLGPGINTPGNETHPFITDSGMLFFSSDGHPGLGGYDIFYSTANNNDDFEKAFNLGNPINSKSDDMGLVIIDEFFNGYFSSNREGGKGSDDIYLVKIQKPLEYIKIEGSVTDSDQFPLQETQVILYNTDNTVFNKTKTDENGKFILYLPNTKNFNIEFKHRFYETKKQEINTQTLMQPSLLLPIVLLKQ